MRKTPLEKHRNHPIHVIEGPIQTKKPGLVHAGKLMCKKCNVLIKWATQEEIDLCNNLSPKLGVTYQDFINKLHQPKQVIDTRLEYMYLVVSYKDKDEVKRLGARWDEKHRLWYVPTSTPHLQKLIPWIHESDQIKLGLKPPLTKLQAMLRACNSTNT